MSENSNPLENLLSKLHGIKNHGNYHQANCPAHPDDKASLSVSQGDDGKLLIKCHAGCSAQNIILALGLSWKSLFPDSANGKRKSKIVAEYDYLDAAGKLLFQTVRLEPKDFRQRRPDGNDGWAWNLNGITPVIYRLPEVILNERVFVVEGEKDSDNLAAIGLCATSSPMGAGKWKAHYNEYLRDKDVVIIPDNDEPGRKHAKSIAEGLQGVAAIVKILQLPGLPDKGDVSDWLRNGGSKEKLLQLVEECAAGALEDPENIDEKLSALLEKARDGNTEAPFDAAPLLATLPRHEDMKWRQRFKEALDGGVNLNSLSEAVSEIRKEQKRADKRKVLPTPSGRPTITVNHGQLPELTDKALSALQRFNSATPSVFSRASILVRIRCDERSCPTIESISESALRGYLARSADWIMETDDIRLDAKPPSDVVRDILSLPEWPFPILNAIIETPTLRNDGSILSKPGYDAQTGLFYMPSSNFRLPKLPVLPTQEHAQRAARFIQDEVLSDFPFKDQASSTNALAMILTDLHRQTLIPKSPLALIDAPQAGTGKTFLAEVSHEITTGRPAAMTTAPDTSQYADEEWRKRITSMLRAGINSIIIDNVEGVLSSPSLAAALTLTTWSDRILGRSEQINIPQRSTWIATGNNIRPGGDLPEGATGFASTPKRHVPFLGRISGIPSLSNGTARTEGKS